MRFGFPTEPTRLDSTLIFWGFLQTSSNDVFFFFLNFQIVESKMDEGSMLVVQLTSLQKESRQ